MLFSFVTWMKESLGPSLVNITLKKIWKQGI